MGMSEYPQTIISEIEKKNSKTNCPNPSLTPEDQKKKHNKN